MLGLVAVLVGKHTVVFAAAMALIGLGRGMTYTCSLFYGLEATHGGGASTGFHEFLIGVGFVSGPFLSGLAAQHFGLRAPFALCLILLIVAVLVEVTIRLRLESDSSKEPPAVATKTETVIDTRGRKGDGCENASRV